MLIKGFKISKFKLLPLYVDVHMHHLPLKTAFINGIRSLFHLYYVWIILFVYLCVLFIYNINLLHHIIIIYLLLLFNLLCHIIIIYYIYI